MKKSYLIVKDVKVPVVLHSGNAHTPANIKFKTYRKGDVIVGELKHANNQPSIILVGRMQPIPIECVQEISTAPVGAGENKEEKSSNAEGTGKVKEFITTGNPKVKYADAMIIGAIVGFIGVHVAQKYEYLPADEKKYKLFGALGGGLLAVYIVYRTRNATPKKVVKINKEE